jgi:hypothetical protein
MAGLVTDRVAEVHVDSPDAVAVPLQRSTHLNLYVTGKPLAGVDVSI